MERVRLWWKPVLAGLIGVAGALSLAGQIVSLAGTHADLARLRAHGTRAAGEARVMTHCGGGRRSYACDPSAVWLDFTDTRQRPHLVSEKPLGSSLYAPHGKQDAQLRIATTIVYDPADPSGAEPAAALDQSVIDLARHDLSPFVVAALMAVFGTGVALGTWPRRTARATAAAAVAARDEARD